MPTESKHPETIVLHAGYRSDPATNAVAVPIYQTTSYQFRDTALQLGDSLFQHVVGRAHNTGVDVPQLLEAEEVRGVLGAVKLVAGRLVDRHRDSVGCGIASVAGMQHDGFRVLAFRRHKDLRVGGEGSRHFATRGATA